MAEGGPRVVVVGGGVLGVSTAAHLVDRGADVTLVTDGALGSGASGRSLSWLNSFAQRSADYHRLRLAGLERYRALAVRAGSPPWLRFDGGLAWAAPGEAQHHREAFEHMRGVGYAAEWVTRDDVAARFPGVDPAAVPDEGAVATPDEGWVDLPSVIDHLGDRVRAGGGQVLTGAGPARVVVTGDRATGVRLPSGDVLGADVVVLATGADVPATVAGLGVTVPDATTPALLVRTRPVAGGLRAVLNTPRVAVRPAPGGALVVDAGWAEREVVARDDGGFDVRDSTVEGLLQEAAAVLSGPAPEPESWGAGRKPIPGDGEPVLGPVPGVRGLVVAFTHSGATLGLVAGELLADEVVDAQPSPLLARFRPDRFA
ncbi:NAD(P)/FAD-dependent oxidoreductase [Cellulomonas aerilata]|uniref:D-amino-acid oxidase n=1 Tax=Cellulomonas aerilata TaxID=515326 RepID=A0A512D845_9CELL|nr:FAD-binding oxidoreductase [Cellulomonas aerilata]GEO32646.1 D-amino-acid oxidase [Cellulomonas aerilata]